MLKSLFLMKKLTETFMLEQIRSLRDSKFLIKLKNPISREIYQLDSVNLIIGDNGTGKTRLMKSVMRDLCTPTAEAEYSIDGPTEDLAVIYYTAAPFHRRMQDALRTTIPFMDVSPRSSHLDVRNFAHDAKEFLTIARLLDLDSFRERPLNFDFAEFFEKVVNSLFNEYSPDAFPNWLSSTAHEFRDSIDTLQKYELDRRQAYNMEHSIVDQNGPYQLIQLKEAEQTVAQMNSEMARAADAHFKIGKLGVSRILSARGPRSYDQACQWVAVCCIMRNFSASRTRQASFIHQFITEQWVNSNLRNWFVHATESIENFIYAIEKTQAGKFSWSEKGASLTFDLSKAIDRGMSEDLLNRAAKLGLTDLGFNKFSSGEAAITHQLASISRAIHQFEKRGKRNFVVFIDEGDLLLHLNWQRQYLAVLDERLSTIRDKLSLKSIQVIVATHSPLLASDVLRESITRLGEATTQTNSFAAPLQKIVNYSFGTPAIGAIAEATIDKLQAKTVLDSTDELIINEIDDDFVRQFLLKKTRQ
ncbi:MULTISPECIES: hypothetical protein [unclassified Massilia]|uniref:hypothetical protein n=1 Tax=unclassified Massilia TaxID=2609279 RepID=UPI00178676AF|nr:MULTISPECIES: hypothetical protein [unclassified Massilia]MBD8529211.1 hypothetical protein [Massilia sp. CFBP 13647]MBD8672605.1 hypothetical protein [Massilia sp. CFBP 13721]